MTDNDRELFSLSDEQQAAIDAGFRLKGTPVIEPVDMHEIMTGLMCRSPQEAIEDALLFGRGAYTVGAEIGRGM
jgi:hypothetical protein